MPVKFRGVSEYSSTYKWQPSFRSAQFQPSPQQLYPEAGLRSDQLNLLIEPSFTHKKRVPHRRPEAGSCLMWFQEDDYADLERSEDAKAEINSKTFVKDQKSVETKTARSANKENVKSVPKVTKKDKATITENKCTWEKDKQSEYVQKAKEQMELSAKALPSKKKASPTKKQPISVPKEKRGSPMKKTPVGSPTKHKQKSPEKEAKPKSPVKESTRSTPLRYRPLHQRMLSRHQSEYQHMYRKHSHFIPSSPLISALDVVHSHSPAIPPHKSPRMASKSEYASKFKPQSPLSKSVPNLSSPSSPSLRMKVRDLTNSPYGHRRSPKKLESEYADQYPARDFPSDVSMRVLDEAKHNKLNREGSAFDKDHMSQIYSPTNKCWEISSVSTSSAVTRQTESDVSAPKSADDRSEKTEDLPNEDEVEKEQVEDDMESIIERDSLDVRSVESSSTLNQPMPVVRKLAWGGDEDDDSTVQGSLVETKSAASSINEGRLPTPQLNQIGGALRTHHDLTTPSRGGALLTSPTRTDQTKKLTAQPPLKQGFSQDLDEKPVKLSKTTPSPIKESGEKSENVTQKPVRVSNTLPAPILNEQKNAKRQSAEAKPSTSDTPKLSKSRKPEVPRFVQPNVRVPIQGALRSQEFQHCGKNRRPSTDFDRISVASAASIASADDLLQRSLQRKDFWKTK